MWGSSYPIDVVYFQQVVMDFGKFWASFPRARTHLRTREAAAVDMPPAPSTTARKSKISLSFADSRTGVRHPNPNAVAGFGVRGSLNVPSEPQFRGTVPPP